MDLHVHLRLHIQSTAHEYQLRPTLWYDELADFRIHVCYFKNRHFFEQKKAILDEKQVRN